ncbi:NAD(P)H-dependent oxidoreductase [Caldimonas sp. KR1-144]|uniref:NAD(P)H-dependent oxidoreductase n=1 Tax=Caldimonas sp. KR1-144 TaxID=3400911 RepID=UPI003C00AD9D
MTGRRILILQGHPDGGHRHLGHALAEAYAQGAREAGHELREVHVADLDFPLLRSQREWQHGSLPSGLHEAQQAIGWAEHIVLCFPLWLGDMPALLKGFLEQVARPGFAVRSEGDNPFAVKALAGRSARVVVTMGMPALVYRHWFRAHSLRSLERNILGFVGIAPIRETLVGLVDRIDEAAASKWFARMHRLGRDAQ